MSIIQLILFTRKGCCLCEGLEKKLRGINLNQLQPGMKLLVKDIDGDRVSNDEKIKYSMAVPVLNVFLQNSNLSIELPRVSARLKEEALFYWLHKHINERLEMT